MKRLFSIILALFSVISLAACGNSKKAESSVSSTSFESSLSNTSVGKSLVVYFSATGNTKRAAEIIAEKTGADIFEIEPSVPYSDSDLDYNNKDSRVYKEHENKELQAVQLKKETPDNFSQYDTVYIGYPIWWGVSAWPVDTFVERNDFKNKTVIPFCTSASSEIGDSAKSLAQKAKYGNWRAGKRFSSSVGDNEIEKWIKEVKNK